MIFQDFTSTIIIGIGILFGLSFILNYLTYKRLDTFLIFLTIIDVILVYGNILPLWTLIGFIIIDFTMLFIKIRAKRSE